MTIQLNVDNKGNALTHLPFLLSPLLFKRHDTMANRRAGRLDLDNARMSSRRSFLIKQRPPRRL
jgi:hypothetical protein